MMKLLLAMGLLALAGCASTKVNVDLGSCVERGSIDGIQVGECEKVQVVK